MNVQAQEKYYYAFEEKIFLNKVVNKFVICFDNQYLAEIKANLQEHNVKFIANSCCILTMESDLQTVKAFLSKQVGIKSINPMYITTDYGSEMIIPDEIVVQFKRGVSQQDIETIHQKYQIVVKEHTKRFQVLSVPIGFDPLEIANIRAESPEYFSVGQRPTQQEIAEQARNDDKKTVSLQKLKLKLN